MNRSIAAAAPIAAPDCDLPVNIRSLCNLYCGKGTFILVHICVTSFMNTPLGN